MDLERVPKRELEMEKSQIFETTNVDLAAFLMLEGIKYLECKTSEASKYGKPVITMRFLDNKQNCRDLERVFMGSDCKKYRDFMKYLLKEVHNTIREMD